MRSTADTIAARDIIHDIIPKLKATKNLVDNTLHAMIQQASGDEELNHQTLLQQEFELEITMIQMNLDHLLERYANEIQDVIDSDGSSPGALLQLDQHERFAIDSAQQLYKRVREIQTA